MFFIPLLGSAEMKFWKRGVVFFLLFFSRKKYGLQVAYGLSTAASHGYQKHEHTQAEDHEGNLAGGLL